MKALGRAVLSFAMACMLSSCGGSGSGLEPAVSSAAGIDRSGFTVVGSVSGFGSVIVGGVEFDTSGAIIEHDGRTISENDLAVGDVVRVIGQLDPGGATGTADRVVFDADVEGPVSAIDPGAGTFVILGRSIRVDASTVFAPSIVPRTIAGLAVGDTVEVSGFLTAGEALLASRIEIRGAVDELKLKGRIDDLNPGARTFRIGDQRVDYGTATLEGFASAAPENGERVGVRGNLNDNDVLIATELERETDSVLSVEGEDGDAKIEGILTARDGDQLRIGTQPVQIGASTRIEGGAAADLEIGIRVEAEGALDEGGVLVATELELKRAVDTELEGAIEAIDAAGRTLVVLGISVAITDTTQFEDGSAEGLRRFGFGDLDVGDFVDVRGALGEGRLLAQRVEREDGDDNDSAPDTESDDVDIELEGAVTTIDSDGLELLGTRIRFADSTRFEIGDAVSRSAFLAAIVHGDRVEVEARRETNGDLVAIEVELED